MSRHYLTEDIAQIKRYFPGARTVALCTPFDITRPTNTNPQVISEPTDTTNPWLALLDWCQQ